MKHKKGGFNVGWAIKFRRLSADAAVNAAMAKDEYQTVEFHYHANGGFLAKTLKEMSSYEVKVAVNLACTYYIGAPCPIIADTSQTIKRSVFNKITNNGPKTFQGAIMAPDGMKMCRVTVQSYKLSQHATFNGTMQDGIKKLAYTNRLNLDLCPISGSN